MSPKRSKPRLYDTGKLLAAQARRGWTNDRLAELADVHPATVGRLMKGETQRKATVKAVADALGLDLGDLVVLERGAVA